MKHTCVVNTGVASFGSKQIQKLQNGDASQGSLIKRALLVFEGTHEGMFGPVTLSKEFLEVMVERFNREYENPKNENDYPPVLKDHSREVESVLGRMLPPLVVADWKNPRSGEVVAGVFGDLRVDDSEAQSKVLSGKYSQVSISFDDDTENLGEIFETSFVAVEAARGAQVLQHKQGDDMDIKELQSKLDRSTKSLASLKGKRSAEALALKASVTSLSLNLKAAKADAKKLGSEIALTSLALRKGVVKGQFKEFVREGRLSKAEFDKINVEEISALPAGSQKILLAAYKIRPVSADLSQFGTQGAEPIDNKTVKKLSTQDMRELMKAQKEGRKPQLSQSLASDDNDDDRNENLGGDNPEEDVVELPGLTMDDIEESLSKLSGLAEMQSRLTESIEKMKETLSKLQGDDKDDDEEED